MGELLHFGKKQGRVFSTGIGVCEHILDESAEGFVCVVGKDKQHDITILCSNCFHYATRDLGEVMLKAIPISREVCAGKMKTLMNKYLEAL